MTRATSSSSHECPTSATAPWHPSATSSSTTIPMTSPPPGRPKHELSTAFPFAPERAAVVDHGCNQTLHVNSPQWFADCNARRVDPLVLPDYISIAVQGGKVCLQILLLDFYDLYTRYASLPHSSNRAVFTTRTLTSSLAASEWYTMVFLFLATSIPPGPNCP